MSDSGFDDSSGDLSNVTPDKPSTDESSNIINTNNKELTITESDSTSHLGEDFNNLPFVASMCIIHGCKKQKNQYILRCNECRM